MKRVRLDRGTNALVWLPVELPIARSDRSLFGPTYLQFVTGSVPSMCLNCPDTPCSSFTAEEISASVGVETPVAPEGTVCPSGALTITAGRSPEVNADTCIGCGLCVMRCPVGAISLDPGTAVATIQSERNSSFEQVPYDPVIFEERRAALERMLSLQPAPFSDAQLVEIQLTNLESRSSSSAYQRMYRLLVRNTFLVLGLPARMKIAGDNNSFTELTVGINGQIALIEIEPGGDVLDAFRRLLAGIAIVSNRYGVAIAKVMPCIVVSRLPNVRVDYYEAVENAEERIGVAVRSIPIATLLLGIRSSDNRLLDLISNQAVLDSTHPTLVNEVSALWGSISGVGLSPEK